MSVQYSNNSLLYVSDDRVNIVYSSTLSTASLANTVWDIIDVSKNTPSQVFTLQTNHNAQYLTLDRSNNQIRQFSGDGSIAVQQWTLEQDPLASPNVFRIINRSTGQVIRANGDGISAVSATTPGGRGGNTVQHWTARDITDSHILTIAEATDGRAFQLYNQYANKVLEIENGNNYEGGLAYVNFYRGSPWQQWHVANKTANRTAPDAVDEPVLSLYPNPAYNELTVSLPSAVTPTMISVVDQITGQTIKVQQQGNGKIDVSSLIPGVYVLKTSDGQHVYQQKFVKQ